MRTESDLHPQILVQGGSEKQVEAIEVHSFTIRDHS